MLEIYKLSYSDLQDYVNRQDGHDFPFLHLVVLRNIMLEPIEPYFQYFALKMGFQAEIKFGEYDNIFQEAVGEQGDVITNLTDCVLVFTKLETLSPKLAYEFTQLESPAIETEKTRIRDFITNVLAGIRDKTDAVILWHSFEMPIYPAYGIVDSQKRDMQIATMCDLNDSLRESLKEYKNAYIVDMNLCLARVGANLYYDLRYWHIGRAPYALDALREIAMEDFKFIRPLKGKNKKCLVFDCDNTLWGGIIGEDGLAGIKLGKTAPGSTYYEFQLEILNIYHRGIILAICSKNNEADVWEVFRKHPDMILKEEHIATAQINWQDKATNLAQIAQDLNIGLDSLVFADDSEFEVNLVKEILPEVEVIHLPKERAAEYRNILSSCGLFDTLTLTAEDKKRGKMYKAEAERIHLKSRATDLTAYYESLEMKVFIKKADSFSIPRIAQLTQRTNQFNLTTKRYSESDIKALAESSDNDILFLRLEDRFGDFGIVGVAILKHSAEYTEIDTFLLSCRVIGRGVEEVLLSACVELSRRRNKTVILGRYIKTNKNSQVADFYQRHGFSTIEQNENEGVFSLDIDQPPPVCPEYFKAVNSNTE